MELWFVKYAEIWEIEMEREYGVILDSLDQESKDSFIDEQKLWEVSIDEKNKQIMTSTTEMYGGGGSYLCILEAELYCRKYRDRADELKDYNS